MRLRRSSLDIMVSDLDLNNSFGVSNLDIVVDDSNISHDAKGLALFLDDIYNKHYIEMNMTESLTMICKLKVLNSTTTGQRGIQLDDNASVNFSRYSKDTNSSASYTRYSSNVGVVVSLPDVEVRKIANPIAVSAGEMLAYSIRVCNDESNTTSHTVSGFDWEVVDVLPDEFDLVGDPQYHGVSLFNGRDMNLSITAIVPGECEVIEYNVTINGVAEFEQEINNTVKVSSTSLLGQIAGERTGTGAGTNDLNSSSTATIHIDRPALVKDIISPKSYYSIGDSVAYRITIGFTGSIMDLKINEHLPQGLKYNNNSVRLILPSDVNVSYNPPLEIAGTGNEMVFEIGDLNITTSGNLYLEINATVEDIPSNTDGVDLLNTLDMIYLDPNNGLTDSVSATSVPVMVGEPYLVVSKAITTDISVPKSAGDIISYRIEIENNGTTTAYNIDWEDKVPLHTGELHTAHQQVMGGTAYLTGTMTTLSDTDFIITTIDEPDDKIILQPFDLSAGAKLIITFDTIIQANVILSETLTNTTRASTQSLVSGGRKHGSNYASSAKVSFSINRLPVAVHSPCLHVTHYGANYGDLGANDILGDGTKAAHIWRMITQPSHGSVVIDADGTFIYRPDADYNGPDSFRYEIEDANGDKSQTDVCIIVDCASSQVSDGGDSFGMINMLIMILLSIIVGFYFMKKENYRGRVS
jgi:uncharacterized repeat protein (TIGR01451 family)